MDCEYKNKCLNGSHARIPKVFLVHEGGGSSRPSSARQQNAMISMSFRLRTDNGPSLNSGLVALGLFMRGSIKFRLVLNTFLVTIVFYSGSHAPTRERIGPVGPAIASLYMYGTPSMQMELHMHVVYI